MHCLKIDNIERKNLMWFRNLYAKNLQDQVSLIIMIIILYPKNCWKI